MPFGYTTLNDGHKIPEIAFGTGTALYQRDASKEVVQALNGGFIHIDTAQMYKNEDSVGKALKEKGLPRSDLYITTKYAGGDIRGTLETSLKELGLDYVDLYLIHFPKFIKDGNYAAAWEVMEKAKEDGLTRSIGVSNFGVPELEELLKIAKVKPAANQIPYNPYNNAENAALLKLAAEHGIIIETYGALTPITKKAGGPVDEPVQSIAQRRGITPAQVLLLWIRAKGIVIVTTTSKESRLQEYLAVGDLEPLSQEDVDAIDAAGSKPSN